MRILVTGGAGFIGSHLSEVLLRRGDDVTVLDNLLTGSRSNLEWCEKQSNFKFLDQDVCAPFVHLERCELIFHLASPASPADYARHPLQTIAANTGGLQNVLELAREWRARVVFASTSEVYGEPLEHPQQETYRGNVSTIGPRACYDESKRLGETLAATYAREFRVDVRIARIFNTYGPRMRSDDGRVIPAFLAAIAHETPLPIFGDGSQTRSFCYVDDLVNGLLLLGEHPRADFEPVNLGNPKEHTVLELAQLLCELARVHCKFEHRKLPTDDPSRRCPDITRARTLLGWEPKVGLREGLQCVLEAADVTPPASAAR